MKEFNNGDVRWFFDEDTEKAYEVRIDSKETPDGFWNPMYYATVLETGRQSFFAQRNLLESEEEATKKFTKELEEDIKERENDLKEIIEEQTKLIKKQKALLEKLKETKNV